MYLCARFCMRDRAKCHAQAIARPLGHAQKKLFVIDLENGYRVTTI
jgi:hypothetical protein